MPLRDGKFVTGLFVDPCPSKEYLCLLKIRAKLLTLSDVLNPRIPMFGTSEQMISTWIEAKTARIKLLWSPYRWIQGSATMISFVILWEYYNFGKEEGAHLQTCYPLWYQNFTHSTVVSLVPKNSPGVLWLSIYYNPLIWTISEI